MAAVDNSQAANGSGGWFNQFIGGLSSLGTAGANAYATVTGAGDSAKTAQPASQAPAQAAPATDWKKYLLPAGAVLGVILLVVLMTGRSGK